MHLTNSVHIFRVLILLPFVFAAVVGCNTPNDPALPDIQKQEEFSYGTQMDLDGQIFMPGEILVVLTDEIEASVGSSFFDQFPLTPVREKAYNWGFLHRMRITDGTPVEEMCDRLKPDPGVLIVEPNYLVHFSGAPYVPNDPMWESDNDPDNDPRTSIWEQWGPAKLGASIVWNDTKGDREVIVAVLDTGIRFTHEDINANIWINEIEYLNPDDGIDNDENGWIDDWWGWNCWEQNNIPFDIDGSDWYHGTACAGVIAATQDNNVGVSGIAPNVRVMAIRANCGILALGPVDNIVEGWDYAKTNGADIISMSFYVPVPTEVLEIAAFDTWDDGNGPMMLAAAGNFNTTEVNYPAGYDCVLAVSAVVPFTRFGVPHDERRISPTWGNWWWGSSYGDHISIAGYGEKYYTIFGSGDDQYWDGVNHPFFNGTSCATPTTAGIMALIISYHPGENGNWYRDRIEQTADDLHEPGYDIHTGWGRVNAVRAVYGSDRFTYLEDQDGFAQLDVTPDGIELYDSIHDVSQDNPFADPWDLYKFTAESDGCIEILLDIYTWGEDLDMALYPNPLFSQMIADSTGENHADSSFESIVTGVQEGATYFLSVYSPDLGNSTTYGLKIENINNNLMLMDESIAPASAQPGDTDVPLLKLQFETPCTGRLTELIINKHSTDTQARFGAVNLYIDSDGGGNFDPGDELIATDSNPLFNRMRFDDISFEFLNGEPLVLFIICDIDVGVNPGSDLYVSMETYKDLTLEMASVEYYIFPVQSGTLHIE